MVEDMDIRCRMFFATEVNLINISLGGIALNLLKRLNLGEAYTLKIESEKDAISLKGVVVWVKMTSLTKLIKGRKVPVYEAGMRFDEVLTRKGNDLLNFVSGHFSDEAIKERVQGLRVKIKRPEKCVILDDRESYSVKMIGLGGMLIESDKELSVEGNFPMEIRLPEGVKSIQFLGRAAYCKEIPEKTPKRYDVGIEFVEMKERNRDQLKEFIDILQTI